MMLRKSLFALSAVLLLGATAACGDDKNDPEKPGEEDVSCDEDPSQAKCQGSSDPCQEDPTQDICKRDNARDEMAYSYVNGLVIPSGDEGEECCWDYTADNNNDPEFYDNALGNLLAPGGITDMIPGEFNIDDILSDLFEDNTLTLLLQYKDLPKELGNGGLDIALHMGTSEDDWAARNGGDGIYELGDKLASISGYVSRETIHAQADTFPISLDLTGFVDPDELADLGLPNVISISLSKVRLALQAIEAEANKISNDVNITADRGKATNFLTGLISGNELANVLNEVVGRGMCKDNINGDVIRFSQDVEVDPDAEEDELALPIVEVIDEDALGDCFDDLGIDLGGIELPKILPVVGGFFDVDSDHDGVADGLSLGLFLSITGAEIE